ncbi:hypothetical protein ATANTOWER_007453 [Ataeniobius toweri]|uniref:Uncharacterized protein n=1 Tax=Ataeniobius toweri TaxID=208326 RepID=A0ABU7C6F0_9TELE|nr:hypothetical protein [Ataeniobius toweri]
MADGVCYCKYCFDSCISVATFQLLPFTVTTRTRFFEKKKSIDSCVYQSKNAGLELKQKLHLPECCQNLHVLPEAVCHPCTELQVDKGCHRALLNSLVGGRTVRSPK